MSNDKLSTILAFLVFPSVIADRHYVPQAKEAHSNTHRHTNLTLLICTHYSCLISSFFLLFSVVLYLSLFSQRKERVHAKVNTRKQNGSRCG